MISLAIQRGNSVFVYNEKNNLLFCQIGILSGYTSNTVSIKKGRAVYTYNEKGALISTHTV